MLNKTSVFVLFLLLARVVHINAYAGGDNTQISYTTPDILLGNENFTSTIMAGDCAGHYRLIEDIELGGSNQGHFPLCNSTSEPFTGSLNSQGYKIRGLNVTNPGGNAGLFGYLHGTVLDLHMENPYVQGRTAGPVAAEIQSDNQVDVTLYGGYAEGTANAGMVAGRIAGDRNHILQTAGNNETLTVIGRHGLAGGAVGYVENFNNSTLTQTGVDMQITAWFYAGGGIGFLVNNFNNSSLTQTGVDMVLNAQVAGGGGLAVYTER